MKYIVDYTGDMQSGVFFRSCGTKWIDFSNALDLDEQTFIVIVYNDKKECDDRRRDCIQYDPRMQIISG